MERRLAQALLKLLNTHAVLSSAEYDRDPSFNSSHPAFKSEENAIKILQEYFDRPILEILDMETPNDCEWNENKP